MRSFSQAIFGCQAFSLSALMPRHLASTCHSIQMARLTHELAVDLLETGILSEGLREVW